MQGEMGVLVLRWAVPPLEGLRRMLLLGDVGSRLASEIDRLEHPVRPPAGWEYLWLVGDSETHTAGPDSPARRPSMSAIRSATPRSWPAMNASSARSASPIRSVTRVLWRHPRASSGCG